MDSKLGRKGGNGEKSGYRRSEGEFTVWSQRINKNIIEKREREHMPILWDLVSLLLIAGF